MNRPHKKVIFLSLVLLIFLSFFGHENSYAQNFSLESANRDRIYFNAIFFKNQIVLGTSDGPYVLENRTITKGKFDYSKPGFISSNGEKLSPGQITLSKEYDFLLPDIYKDSYYSAFIHNDKLLIFVNGTMLQYRILTYAFKSLPSVRAISEHFLGTYSGIFNWDGTLAPNLPSYTSGKIVELSNGIAICWDGLYLQTDTITKNYLNTTNLSGDIIIGGQNLGSARDIFELGPNDYLLFTTFGLFRIDPAEDKSTKLVEAKDKFEPRIMLFNEYYLVFLVNSDIYKYNITSETLTLLYHSPNRIVDAYTTNDWLFYVLSEKSLTKINLLEKTTKTLINELNEPLNLIFFYNKLVVTGNFGMDIYDLATEKIHKNLISNEFNKYAYYINDDELYLGTVSGYYTLTLDGINSLYFVNNIEKERVDAINNELKIPKIFTFILIGIIILLIVLLFYYRKKLSLVRDIKFEADQEDIIKSYIIKNISTVKISQITEEFNIDTNTLYKIFEGTNPGEFIRNERLKLVRKLRKEKVSEEEIAKKTGFSLSYLKKI
jgi:AraC-like DNA-binding protein